MLSADRPRVPPHRPLVMSACRSDYRLASRGVALECGRFRELLPRGAHAVVRNTNLRCDDSPFHNRIAYRIASVAAARTRSRKASRLSSPDGVTFTVSIFTLPLGSNSRIGSGSSRPRKK